MKRIKIILLFLFLTGCKQPDPILIVQNVFVPGNLIVNKIQEKSIRVLYIDKLNVNQSIHLDVDPGVYMIDFNPSIDTLSPFQNKRIIISENTIYYIIVIR